MANRTPPWVIQGERMNEWGWVYSVGVRNRRGASGAKMLQNTKMLALHSLALCFGERKELEVGHCVSGLQKKEKENREHQSGGKGKTERERESAVDWSQLTIHWIVMCSNKSAMKGRGGGVPDWMRNVFLSQICMAGFHLVSLKASVTQKSASLKRSSKYSAEGHVSVSVSPF